jgi:hypothetical protein
MGWSLGARLCITRASREQSSPPEKSIAKVAGVWLTLGLETKPVRRVSTDVSRTRWKS